MSWNLWPSAAPELPQPDDPASSEPFALEPLADPRDSVQVLDPEATTDETPGCWHVRPVPSCEAPRPSPLARREPELRRQRSPEQPDLRGIGLPEHLVPPRGGIFTLLSLLERAPAARLPTVRPGDKVAVVAVAHPDGARGSVADTAELADDVRRALAGDDAELDEDNVHVFAWPGEEDPRAEAALVEAVRSLRARLELLAVHPDCPGTTAYAACRSLPSAQLYLTGVLGAQRPAAPLGWGAPVAFVDGRRASPAVLAALFADRLAGGVA